MASRGILATFLAAALLGAVCAPSAVPASSGDQVASLAKKKCKAKGKGKAGSAKKKCKKKTSPLGHVTINPSSADYGFILGRSSKTLPFTVTNAGGGSTGVPDVAVQDFSTNGGNPSTSFFLASSSCEAPLPPSGTCTVEVQFEPPFDGNIGSGTLTVSATNGGTAVAQLTGHS